MNFSGSTASGVASITSMVSSSTFFAPVTPFNWKARCEVVPSARSIENTASSALNGVPSWKLTPGRSLKRQVVAPSACQDCASDGSMRNCSSRLTSES